MWKQRCGRRMKAILVIDIKGAEHIIETSYKPEGYARFVLDKDNEHFCAYIPIDDAELLPMPEELDEIEAMNDHDELIYRTGYNDALRKIKGEGWTCKIGGFFDR